MFGTNLGSLLRHLFYFLCSILLIHRIVDTPVIIHVFVEIVRFDVVVLEASLTTLIELARWVVQIGQLHNLDLVLQVEITF